MHDFAPIYLGVTLTYRKHTENVRDRVKSRCNIISKLAGTDWGAPAPAHRASAIALVYSVAEYRVPVWGRCVHVLHIDTQLNIEMRTVSCALDQPTLTGCLCSATSRPHRFAVTVPPCRSTCMVSSSRIVFPSRPCRVSDLAGLS